MSGVLQDQIPSLLINTFGGYTASRSNPQWIKRVEAEVSALVARLLQAGLAEREGDLIHLTLLGRACGSSSLSFESGLRLIELMRPLPAAQTDPLQVLGILQVLSKRASLLSDWIEGTAVDELERRYSTTPYAGAISYGDIIRIADGARFHLRSAHQILSTLFPNQPTFLSRLDRLLNRLEFGLPEEALALMGIPLALTRGQYLALFASGCTAASEATTLPIETLTDCIGADRASLLTAR